MRGFEAAGSEPAHLRRRRKRSRATGEARGLASKQIHSWFCMVLANLLLFANFVTIKYLLYCGSRRNRLAGTEPIPMRFRNTGWGTLRRPFALVSIENVVIVTESCEMTVKYCALRHHGVMESINSLHASNDSFSHVPQR